MPSRLPKAPSKEKAQVVFGATLRGFREAQALTQEALAERAELHTITSVRWSVESATCRCTTSCG